LDRKASKDFGAVSFEKESEGLTGAGDFRRHHVAAMIKRGR